MPAPFIRLANTDAVESLLAKQLRGDVDDTLAVCRRLLPADFHDTKSLSLSHPLNDERHTSRGLRRSSHHQKNRVRSKRISAASCMSHRLNRRVCGGPIGLCGGCVHSGASDLTSLYTIESISAWNEASMMFSDTPTVDQRSPVSSSLSINTRVTASVPPLRMRTR